MDMSVNISGNVNFFVPVLSGSPDEARRLLRYYEKELEGRKTEEAAALLDFLQDFLEECQEEQDKDGRGCECHDCGAGKAHKADETAAGS